MNIKWNHKNDGWPIATSELRDHIYIVSDGKEMTIARWVDLCHEDPNCGADPDEFDFLPVKDMEILYWYGPVSAPICDISDYQPERSKRGDLDKLESDWHKLRSDWNKLGCGALNSQVTD